MLWFILSLGAAFFMATNGAYAKRFFSHLSSWEMGAIPFLYASPICLIGLLFIDIPRIQNGFYPALAWVLPMTGFAMALHFRAIHISPLSLTLPFLSFTPVFVLLTGDLILDEQLSSAGVMGMLLVVAGGYIINIDSARHGVLGPVKAIFREPGSSLMIVVAALYGLTSVGGKVMILNSSPMFTALLLFGAWGPIFTIILLLIGKAKWNNLTERPLLGLGAGIITFCEIVVHNLAVSMVAAAYMITIKRMAGIFSVLYGWLLFHETGIRFRLMGTIVMTVGASLILIYG